jgi:predicted secreted hydrolase
VVKRFLAIAVGLLVVFAVAFGVREGLRRAAPPAPELDLNELLREGGEGFARAGGAWAFAFPQDHGAHPEFRTELWSVKGHLEGDAGRYFGVQLVLLRLALQPEVPQRDSAWAANQVYAAQLALTDPAGAGFTSAQRLSRAALGLAGAAAEPVRVWVEDWSLEAGPDGRLRLQAGTAEARLALELEPVKAALDETGIELAGPGDGPGGGFHFYLMPRLALSGMLTLEGEGHRVDGLGWVERAWGEVPVSRGQVALDRFALQLEDGRDLLCLQLRRVDASGTPVPSCLVIDAGGTATTFRRREIALEPGGVWRSPTDGTGYPLDWRLALPAIALDLSLRAVVEDQELSGPLRAWRGAVTVQGSDAGEPVTGRGFVDVAGYPKPGD